MQLTDEAIVLSCSRLGENNYVLSTFGRDHGRISGLVRKPTTATQGLYQTGNLIEIVWQARLADHLGTIRAEMIRPIAAQFMHLPGNLLAMQAACGWCTLALPDQQPYAILYQSLLDLFENLKTDHWLLAYALWEINLLQRLGFGLDISACAVTGVTDDLAFISPKTGRAVSRGAAQPWIDKLLPLPDFIYQFYANDNWPQAINDNLPARDILESLRLSGFFLDQHILKIKRKQAPTARSLLIRKIQMLQECGNNNLETA